MMDLGAAAILADNVDLREGGFRRDSLLEPHRVFECLIAVSARDDLGEMPFFRDIRQHGFDDVPRRRWVVGTH